MKGPSMHKGTSGHKKALNRYQELNVERSPAKELKGDQHKIDKNKDGKISKTDFDMMKKSPAKMGKMDSAAKLKKDSPADLKKDSPADLKASPAKKVLSGPQHSKTRDTIKKAKKKVSDAATYVKGYVKELGATRGMGASGRKMPGVAGRHAVERKNKTGRYSELKPSKTPQTPPKTAKEKADVIAKMKKKNSPSKMGYGKSPAKMKGKESSTQKGLRERGVKKSKSPHVALTKSGKVEKMGLGGDKMVKRKGAPKDFKF
tara:strand:- start:77 stop:856 length:780 start_codon:yes stop_codon:yes gene_type:complete